MSAVHWDPYNPNYFKDPYPIFRRLREEAPLYYNDEHDFYAISRYADVEHALKDVEAFSSSRGNILEINADVDRWLNDAGDAVVALDGVQYQPGNRVRYGPTDWPQIVMHDWGPAGVEIHAAGDPSIRAHVTDRGELRPGTD